MAIPLARALQANTAAKCSRFLSVSCQPSTISPKSAVDVPQTTTRRYSLRRAFSNALKLLRLEQSTGRRNSWVIDQSRSTVLKTRYSVQWKRQDFVPCSSAILLPFLMVLSRQTSLFQSPTSILKLKHRFCWSRRCPVARLESGAQHRLFEGFGSTVLDSLQSGSRD